MVEAGELAAVTVLGRSTRYELAGLEHHHHFLCEECDRLFDLPGCPETFRKLAPRGFRVTGHELILTGRCKACA
jgi:Fur family ferric uptake transcriptional regulator